MQNFGTVSFYVEICVPLLETNSTIRIPLEMGNNPKPLGAPPWPLLITNNMLYNVEGELVSYNDIYKLLFWALITFILDPKCG